MGRLGLGTIITKSLAWRRGVLSRWLNEERGVAAGTLVEVEGSAPLPAGGTMLIDDSGRVEGSITGGCVEAAVVQEAADVLDGGAVSRVMYGISDELAGTVGVTCGGLVHVLVYELVADSARAKLATLDAAARGQPAAIATVLDSAAAGAQVSMVDDPTAAEPLIVGSCASSGYLRGTSFGSCIALSPRARRQCVA